MKKWKCTVCSQVFEGDTPPVPCPVCSAGEEAFEELEAAVSQWKCTVCSQVFEGDAPPVPCPVCGAAEEAFEEIGKAVSQWKCTICGQIFEGSEPPVPCPVCSAGQDAFEPVSEQKESFRRDTAEHFVLIGGGVASLEAAKAIRARNATAAITMICGEGVVPYNRPGVSDVLGEETSFVDLMLQAYPWYAEQGIRLITDAQATKVDTAGREILLSDGRRLAYDKLLLATGANPFNPVKKDADAIPVSVLRTFLEADSIAEQAAGKRVIVLGGGILGLEAAVALRARDSKVTVVQLENTLLPLQTDAEVAGRLRRALEEQGIAVRTGVSIDRVTSEGAALTDGSFVEADFVLVSIGVRAEKTLAAEAGIQVNRGILVDSGMRTSVPGVFAAGDCAEFEGKAPGQWNVAMLQGQTAGAVMAGEDGVKYAAPVPALAFETEGFRMFEAGTIQGDHLTEVIARSASGAYRKLVLKDGRLIGVLMAGSVSGSGKAIKMLEKNARMDEAVSLIAGMK